MLEVICPNCEKKNQFDSKNSLTEECGYCFEVFPPTIQISDLPPSAADATTTRGEQGEICGLVLIYQINQEKIEIDVSEKRILGRRNHGAELLSAIFFNDKPVISKKHCSIEFRNGGFYLQDENSTNGTFYSVKKMSCKDSPQKIEHNSIIYLGEEPFVARVIQKEPETFVQNEPAAPENDDQRVIIYRCNETGCGFESQEKLSVCPRCDTYNSLVEIS